MINGYIRGGAGTRPKIFIKPDNRPDPTGFCYFEPEPAKNCIKSARIGSARVGRIGRVLPTPSINNFANARESLL
jgi:hypothetical protein